MKDLFLNNILVTFSSNMLNIFLFNLQKWIQEWVLRGVRCSKHTILPEHPDISVYLQFGSILTIYLLFADFFFYLPTDWWDSRDLWNYI